MFKLHYMSNGQHVVEEFDTLHTAVDWAETRASHWCIVGPGDNDYPHFVYRTVIGGVLVVDFADDTEIANYIDELIEEEE